MQTKSGVEVPSVTYKQLVQNYTNKGFTAKQIKQAMSKLIKEVNQFGTVLIVRNLPGTILKGDGGTYMINKAGKSVWIGP